MNTLPTTKTTLTPQESIQTTQDVLNMVRDLFPPFLKKFESSPKKESYVYFLQRPDGKIKIGRAQDVKSRIKQVEAMCGDKLNLLLVTPGGSKEETRLHRMFQDAKHQGGVV